MTLPPYTGSLYFFGQGIFSPSYPEHQQRLAHVLTLVFASEMTDHSADTSY